MADINKLVPTILLWEGKFQMMKEDRGNYFEGKLIGTNMGITPAAYYQTFKKKPTTQDMKNMTHEQFMQVLKKFYWDRWRANEIKSQSIADILVDFVWASGSHGITKVQEMLGLTADGAVGPKTIATINNYPSQEILFNKIKERRLKFVDSIVANNPSQAKFRDGWRNRINYFKFNDK